LGVSAQAPSGRGRSLVPGLAQVHARRWLALGLGALLPLAFAPFGIYPLAPLCLAGLFALWEDERPRAAASQAFCFGFGAFLVGLHWLYISLHTFGKAPLFVSLPLMLGLIAVLSGYLAGLAYVVNRGGEGNQGSRVSKVSIGAPGAETSWRSISVRSTSRRCGSSSPASCRICPRRPLA